MKGAILEEGFQHYTNLNLFLPITEEVLISYNWLLTDIDSNYYSDSITKNNYDFLSGENFVELIKKDENRFAWGVFSAFPRGMELKEILMKGFPFANGYTGFWKNPITTQNPLTVIEMVLWDGVLALIISRNDKIIDKFLDSYKFSRDLEKYNDQHLSFI